MLIVLARSLCQYHAAPVGLQKALLHLGIKYLKAIDSPWRPYICGLGLP